MQLIAVRYATILYLPTATGTRNAPFRYWTEQERLPNDEGLDSCLWSAAHDLP